MTKIKWTAHPGPQTEALRRPEFEVLYGGARGGGKTDAGLAWLLRHIDNPRYRALIIRKNADDLSDWIDRARVMYQDTGATFAYRPAIITFPSGAIFRTGHLKDDNSYGKYLGHEYQRMVIEELTQIPTEELYLKLISSCRTTIPELEPRVFCTTNPGGIGHVWVKSRFVDVASPGMPYVDKETGRTRIFIPAKVTDNPTLMTVDPAYLNFLDGLPDQLRKAWRDGNWDIIAGQVFSEWSLLTHVVEPFTIEPQWPLWLAMDWGVNSPFSVGWYTRDYDGHTYLIRELYMNGIDFMKAFGKPLTPKRLAIIILKMNEEYYRGHDYDYCVCDPSMWNKTVLGENRGKPEGESIAEIMMSVGLKLIRADNDRINGLARYREALAIAPDRKPWYQVFSTCRDTIRTIPSLPYSLTKLEDVDTDAEDHCYDRDRYFFMSRPVKPTHKEEKPLTPMREAFLRATGEIKDERLNRYEAEWNAD